MNIRCFALMQAQKTRQKRLPAQSIHSQSGKGVVFLH